MRDINAQTPVVSGFADISLRDFAMPLFRRMRLLNFTFLGLGGAIIALAALQGPTYSSRMALLVNRERQDPLVSTEPTQQVITSDNPVTPEEINSEVELLRSRDVLEHVVLANHLEEHHGFSLLDTLRPGQTADDRIERAVKGLAKGLTVNNIKSSNLIEVTYKSPDPQLSFGVLTSLGEFYVAKHVAVHRPTGSFEFFAHQADKYRDELSSAEAKLRDFGQEHSVAAPDELRTNLAAQYAEFVGQMHAAEQAIAGDEERIKNDREQMNATPSRSTTLQAASANDKLIDDLNASLFAAETKRTQLAMKYDASYPLVQEADQEIANAKSAIARAEEKRYVTETTDRDPTYELLREDIAKSQADLAAQHATLAATKRSVKSIQGEMVQLSQLSLSQQDLQREAKADESNYLLYLAKREQERTSNALDMTRIGNVAIAVPPALPVLPTYGWPVIILGAIVVALVISLGVAYTADYMDTSFHTPAQVIDILGVPVVVSVSKKKTA